MLRHRMLWLTGSLLVATGIGAAELRVGVPIPKGLQRWRALEDAAGQTAGLPTAAANLVLVGPAAPGEPAAAGAVGIAGEIRAGALDGGLVLGHEFESLGLGRDALAYAVPLLFRTDAQVEHVRAAMDSEILARLSDGPFEALAISELGWAYVMSTQGLSSPEEWRQRRIWVPAQGREEDALRALGWTTLPLPAAAVPTALGNGTLDAVIAPLSGAVYKRWHRHLTRAFALPFAYTYGVWVVRDAALADLPDGQRGALRQQFARLDRALRDATRREEDEAREVLRSYEMAFVEPDAAMRRQWSDWGEALRQALDDHCKPGEDVLRRVCEHIEKAAP
ncbi:MAG: TRAP transporter substrate-binding protein DctP [Lentisphaeria bacterium]|nr:TRAP transporter substrate-binding protein DctP [Lentisphaeria bacterium]